MRFHEIKHLIIQEARLDELKMSPSALETFAKSSAAQGIRAGFEAELIFRGIADNDGRGYGPDFDEDINIDSIDELESFFLENNSRHQVSRLVRAIEDDGWLDYVMEVRDRYVQENLNERMDSKFDYWWDDNVEELVRNALQEAREYNAREIDNIIKAGLQPYRENEWDSRETYQQMESIYDEYKMEVAENAREQFDEDNADEVRDELEEEFDNNEEVEFGEYLESELGDRRASNVYDSYSHIVDWPYYTSDDDGEGGYNERAADHLADSLHNAVGMRVVASGGYHSTRRTADTWIIEPDSSLDPDDSDDMAAEIVSPPMPLNQCLEKMEAVFNWADRVDAYANKSTGFHMGVSLPITNGKVDFVKLALFLGDEYVLEEFGRSSNSYAVAAIKKIGQRVDTGGAKISDAMTLMKHGLIELAERSIMNSTGDGFGKYTSINPKGAYIEFRSAGGTDYIMDFKKAKNTLLRYAQAMSVAANPAAERQEYYKKLYKLISPSGDNSALDLFARYSTGNISKEELKKRWAEATLEKEAPQEQQKSTWKVFDKSTGQYVPGVQFSGYTESEALALFKQATSPGSSWLGFRQMFKDKYELRNVSASTGKWAIIDRDTGKTLEVVDSENRGDAADLAMEKYAGKGIDYYVEPVQADVPKPKLSRRAELARRIKEPKDTQQQQQQTLQPGQHWEVYSINTGTALKRLEHTNRAAAAEEARTWIRMNGGNVEDFAIRATGDSIQVNSTPAGADVQWRVTNTQTGDSSIITAPSRLRANAMVMDLARRMGVDSVNFTIDPYTQPTPDSTSDIQQRRTQAAQGNIERQPSQVTTDAGIPMWEIYVRETGQAVNRFPDHNMTTAWSTAQQWLRDAHAPESTWNGYSVRPLVNQ